MKANKCCNAEKITYVLRNYIINIYIIYSKVYLK